jgi:hypothetical protein
MHKALSLLITFPFQQTELLVCQTPKFFFFCDEENKFWLVWIVSALNSSNIRVVALFVTVL